MSRQRLVVLVTACLLASSAGAAEDPPVEEEVQAPAPPPAPAPTPTTEAPAPVKEEMATEEAESPVSPLTNDSDVEESVVRPPVRFYGIIKPTMVYAFQAFESFSQPNETAITAAANPVVGRFVDQGRVGFQVAQSRLGAIVNEEGTFRGQVELDFWDPTKPNPSLGYGLRLRVLKAAFVPSKRFAIEVGRDFELHAPIGSHTINLVGALLQAGNISQFRNQIKVFYRPGVFEMGLSVGMQGDNNGSASASVPASDGAFELSRFPTVAARVALVTKPITMGISGIGTQLIMAKGTPESRTTWAYSGAFYLVASFLDSFEVRMEGYTGRNQNNIGLRALGFGRAATVDASGVTTVRAADMDEAGGFVSIRQSLGDWNAIYAMIGTARIKNQADVIPDYTTNADGSVTLTTATTGPGIKHNTAIRVGYELRPVRYFAFVIEGLHYNTLHSLFAADQAQFNPRRRAYGIESGIVLTF